MIHTYNLTGSKSIHSLMRHKVRSNEWKMDDHVDFYRNGTKVFVDLLPVAYHHNHYVDETTYKYRVAI